MKKKTKKKIRKEWKPDGYIKSHLRKIWRWSPGRRECLKAGRCITCLRKTETLYADHIAPVVDPLTGFTTWDTYISRLFDGPLQPLCGDCHKVKSAKENALRRATKKAKKDLK